MPFTLQWNVHSPKLVVTLPFSRHSTLQWHPCNGTQQWHHVHCPKVGHHPPPNHSTLQWHPAPSNGTTPPTIAQYTPLPPPQHIAHYNGTLQWHPAMAPRPLQVGHPPNHSTLQWHPTMAPSNGTTSTPLKLVVTLHPNHSTLQWQPTMAPAWCHVQSAKVVRRPPPFVEVRTPIATGIWG